MIIISIVFFKMEEYNVTDFIIQYFLKIIAREYSSPPSLVSAASSKRGPPIRPAFSSASQAF